MYIIDKHKDFYDYYSHLYDIDKRIIFDRRNSVLLENDLDLTEILEPSKYRFHKVEDFYAILEIGTIQYLIKFEVKNRDNINQKITGVSLELLRLWEDNIKRFNSIISLQSVSLNYEYRIKNKIVIKGSYEEVIQNIRYIYIELPILKNTSLTKFLNAELVWMEINNYISSLDNDKDIYLPMTDKDKAQNHGFDKNSFRNPIK